MLLFSALVAGSFSLGVRAANLIDPAAITVARFIIAAGVLAGIALLVPGRGRPRALLESPWRYLLLGGAFAGYFVLMFEGLKTAPAVAASAVFTLTPIMAAGFDADEIWDIGAIAAFFGMSNRMANAGDFRANDEFYMLGRQMPVAP